jgi:prolyl 4-hydroxylase
VTPEEADYILETAKSGFDDSLIVSGRDENIRKSQTAWLKRDDPIVNQLFTRLSKQFDFDIRNTEDLQVVKYEPGGFYNEHHDSCCEDTDHCKDFSKTCGQRKLTILVYLNDDFEGGFTDFPNLGLHIKAEKLGAIVFHPLEDGGNRCHPYALHKGTPVTSGIKYICNIWVREKVWN